MEQGLTDYPAHRDRPDLDATSRMSAHLKFGTIHPRTMAADLASGNDAYLRELAFRDFYAAVLYHWPDSAWRNWNRDFDAIEVDDDEAALRAFEAWKAGRTGFPIVDAGMRQLAATGFMHNRVRMIVASFLVKDLHLPWQWGARWFLEQLVDGDLANNQHGWQWAAGCGTDAAPYFRVFNPTLQGAKFDPDGAYIRRWVPELADVVDVHKLGTGRPRSYPEPIVDHAEERLEALREVPTPGLTPRVGIRRSVVCQNVRKPSLKPVRSGGATVASTEVERNNGVDVEEVPSAAWGWSELNIKVIHIGGILSAIFLLVMMHGNHIGHVENWFLITFAALILLAVARNIWMRRRGWIR